MREAIHQKCAQGKVNMTTANHRCIFLVNVVVHVAYSSPPPPRQSNAPKFASVILRKGNHIPSSQLRHISPMHQTQTSLFAYWLWSCVVTVLILLTKYWRPHDVTLLNYFLKPWGITSACWKCSMYGRSISLAATIRPPLSTTPPPFSGPQPPTQLPYAFLV